jgi:hypothetical protein
MKGDEMCAGMTAQNGKLFPIANEFVFIQKRKQWCRRPILGMA